MIIPIRCMGCGNMIADKWRYYQNELKRVKGNERYYFDGKDIPETPEKKIMNTLKLRRPCCRKHFLTQIDLMEKI
jgi:DNA-directed RNA polymerase I, II, and III subunit RPABC5